MQTLGGGIRETISSGVEAIQGIVSGFESIVATAKPLSTENSEVRYYASLRLLHARC
jgi:hypothetical protein